MQTQNFENLWLSKHMILGGGKEKQSNTAGLQSVWELTALIRESSTLTAKAVPQAKG